MKMPGEGIRQYLNQQESNEGAEARLKTEISEYVAGIDANATVEFETYKWSREAEEGDGLKMTFKYNGREEVYRDQELNDASFDAAKDVFDRFYRAAKNSIA